MTAHSDSRLRHSRSTDASTDAAVPAVAAIEPASDEALNQALWQAAEPGESNSSPAPVEALTGPTMPDIASHDTQVPSGAVAGTSSGEALGWPALLGHGAVMLAGMGALGAVGLSRIDRFEHQLADQKHQLDAKVDGLAGKANDELGALQHLIDDRQQDVLKHVDQKLDDAQAHNGAQLQALGDQAQAALNELKQQLADSAHARDELNARIDTLAHQLDLIVNALVPGHAGGAAMTPPPSGVFGV
ncbi:hypothetical protein ACNI65_13180 [Roseateles sp. So40a]|uniref:hypothetical protein n=1 Tax=Roseateles sp. So40a TaxID=3400226 RepID=UPI003A880086